MNLKQWLKELISVLLSKWLLRSHFWVKINVFHSEWGINRLSFMIFVQMLGLSQFWFCSVPDRYFNVFGTKYPIYNKVCIFGKSFWPIWPWKNRILCVYFTAAPPFNFQLFSLVFTPFSFLSTSHILFVALCLKNCCNSLHLAKYCYGDLKYKREA